MTDTTKTTPNPGSDEAIAQGCSCPVIDNKHGHGSIDGNFWMSGDCPIHSTSSFMQRQFADLEIKAVYERLAKI